MVLNVLIKNENSNIYGTGGQMVKWHCSHRLSGVELLYCKVEFRILWDTCTICWPNAPPPFTLLRHQVNCCTVVAWPCYALCAESDLKPVYLSVLSCLWRAEYGLLHAINYLSLKISRRHWEPCIITQWRLYYDAINVYATDWTPVNSKHQIRRWTYVKPTAFFHTFV